MNEMGVRWPHTSEMGSFQPLWDGPPGAGLPLEQAYRLYGSGRAALLGLIQSPIGRRWRRLYVPSYYCQGVASAASGSIEVRQYRTSPVSNAPHLHLGDDEAAVVVEYFGQRSGVSVSGGVCVVDRTHDPLSEWSYGRLPDYVFASLRKTLPLPDGGVVWSPTGGPLPQTPLRDVRHEAAADAIGRAMAAKGRYLSGATVSKDDYRNSYALAEPVLESSGAVDISSWSREALAQLPVEQMRRKRLENISAFHRVFQQDPQGMMMHDSASHIVLMASSRMLRDTVRRALIANEVYPAVLWPLPEGLSGTDEMQFSNRMLALHADYRYGPADIARLSSLIESVTDVASQE